MIALADNVITIIITDIIVVIIVTCQVTSVGPPAASSFIGIVTPVGAHSDGRGRESEQVRCEVDVD
ncbi:hypothetical protein DPMN_176156 [Dreissena polymorpha]|uniref:Uncharacterized protein n=1 Tax=Dreissena polymorpha TaxID=45954 RepID=A0A9D4E8J6_DREPO|nr:hypothetical protein DPMN_176156 [Dreissena polymorpha]